MKIPSFIPTLAVLVTIVAGAILPTDTSCGTDVKCGPVQLTKKHHFIEHPSRSVHRLTNAQLLRRGLPLKPPVLRRGTPVRRTDPSAAPAPDPEPSQPAADPEPSQPASNPDPSQPASNTDPSQPASNPEPSQPAPDPEPSQPASDPEPSQPTTPPAPSTITHRGFVQVINAASGQLLGYMSTVSKVYLMYQSTSGNALVVNFETDLTGTGTNLDVNIENWTAAFPHLGLVQGPFNSDGALAQRFNDFTYLGGIESPGTPPNSIPTELANSFSNRYGHSRATESAVWAFDPTGTLTPHWVNPDGFLVTTQSFVDKSSIIYAAGSVSAFGSSFGTLTAVTFKLVPIQS